MEPKKDCVLLITKGKRLEGQIFDNDDMEGIFVKLPFGVYQVGHGGNQSEYMTDEAKVREMAASANSAYGDWGFEYTPYGPLPDKPLPPSTLWRDRWWRLKHELADLERQDVSLIEPALVLKFMSFIEEAVSESNCK